MITQLFNGCYRLKYVPSSVPSCFKTTQIIMIKKSDKPAEQVTSYRPISLLPTISKLFEKLLLKTLQPLVNIPEFQFGFRNKHSTIDQVHRVTSMIEKAFEEKNTAQHYFLMYLKHLNVCGTRGWFIKWVNSFLKTTAYCLSPNYLSAYLEYHMKMNSQSSIK